MIWFFRQPRILEKLIEVLVFIQKVLPCLVVKVVRKLVQPFFTTSRFTKTFQKQQKHWRKPKKLPRMWNPGAPKIPQKFSFRNCKKWFFEGYFYWRQLFFNSGFPSRSDFSKICFFTEIFAPDNYFHAVFSFCNSVNTSKTFLWEDLGRVEKKIWVTFGFFENSFERSLGKHKFFAETCISFSGLPTQVSYVSTLVRICD